MTTMNLAELRSHENVLGIHVQPARQRAESNPLVRGCRTAKRIMLMFLLAGSFMFYYVLDKMNQALSVF
jgi:hypothetical protein